MSKKAEQAVFDKAAQHCIKQGVRAVSKDGVCLYRDKRGRKCAVGCLLTTSELRAINRLGYEGELVETLPAVFLASFTARLGLGKHSIEVLGALQTCHDECLDAPGTRTKEGLHYYTTAMAREAKRFGLKTAALKAAYKAKTGEAFKVVDHV